MEMEKDNETVQEQDEAKKPQAPKIGRTPKPSIEGINAPKINSEGIRVNVVKDGEEGVPDDFRIISGKLAQRTGRKNHAVRNVFIFLVILAGLGAASFVAFRAYWSKDGSSQFPGVPVSEDNSRNSSGDTNTSATGSDGYAYAVNPSSTPQSTETASSTTAAPSSPSTAPAKQLKVNSTPTGYLNVRSTPSSSGKALTQVHPGETYPYTNTQSGWYEISLPDGQSGWVSGQYITPQ